MGTRRPRQVKGTESESKKPQESEKAKSESKKEVSGKKVSKAKRTVRGAKYAAAKKLVKGGDLPVEEAVKKVKEASFGKFDASIDAHINLGLESGKKEEQRIRTFISLPHGTGKKIRVLVFAEAPLAKKVEEAGADAIGNEDLIEKIANEEKAPNFDVIVATPSFMPKVAKVARILGPKGLMPSPKTDTVTDDPTKAVKELKMGKVELRTEEQPIIHVSLGKVSFADEKIVENLNAIVQELNRIKPPKVKGDYIKSIFLASTMGPSVRVILDSLG